MIAPTIEISQVRANSTVSDGTGDDGEQCWIGALFCDPWIRQAPSIIIPLMLR